MPQCAISLRGRVCAWDCHGELMLLILVWLLESFWAFFSSPFSWRRFFQAACEVPELQDKFNIDEYSDLVTLTKPVIYISIGEIINTHTVSTRWSQLLLIKKMLLLTEMWLSNTFILNNNTELSNLLVASLAFFWKYLCMWWWHSLECWDCCLGVQWIKICEKKLPAQSNVILLSRREWMFNSINVLSVHLVALRPSRCNCSWAQRSNSRAAGWSRRGSYDWVLNRWSGLLYLRNKWYIEYIE